MSIRQSYTLSEAVEESRREAARRRAAAELARRELELARSRAERAAALYYQTLNTQETRLDAAKSQLSGLSARSRDAAQDLDRLESRLASSRAELHRAQTALGAEIERVSALENQADTEAMKLRATLEEARAGLEAVDRVARAGVGTVDELARQTKLGTLLTADQREIEARMHQLEAEVQFVTREAELAPAAMMTLLAMEANGYHLRSTSSRDGLVSYFAQEDARHQIAVRMAPVNRSGENVERWDLLAETFDMVGETCVYEMDDFETAVEDLDLGVLERGSLRVYPKDDSSPKERRQGLPRPIDRRRKRKPASRRKELNR